MTSSRIPGFYNLTMEERRAKLAEASHLSPEDLFPFTTGGLSAESADPTPLQREPKHPAARAGHP